MQCYNVYDRSNIAVMFLSDLVLDGLEIDWSAHLPLMLHVIFLGKYITPLTVDKDNKSFKIGT